MNNFIDKKTEEFDKKLGKNSELNKFLVLKYGSYIHHESAFNLIKEFISQALTEQQEAVKEIVSKELLRMAGDFENAKISEPKSKTGEEWNIAMEQSRAKMLASEAWTTKQITELNK